jgi:hypothetical protein
MRRATSIAASSVWSLVVLAHVSGGAAAELTPDRASSALRRAVTFFRQNCGTEGGYVYRVSSDLKLWAGEDPVGPRTAWLQPPGTPAVGMAYLEAYRVARDPLLLEAARETADALIRTQLVSGGWDNILAFDPEWRGKYAFRVESAADRKGSRSRNTTTFDDDKSQSAVRFLMQLDRELEFQDARLHEATLYALDAFVKAQYPNGAWPQRYSEFPAADKFPIRKASIPATWPREFPGADYQSYYTLNDGAISDLMESMLDAFEVYQEPRYLEAARRAGDFFLLAQLPDPQPGWSQQYNLDMHPAWARKFEPPAITGGESQRVMQSLMLLYRRTADPKYLEPIPRALAYYRTCVLPDGGLARFYELGSNRPLYFTKDYQLTYADDDVPTHYSFKVANKLEAIETEYQRVLGTPRETLWKPRVLTAPKPSDSVTRRAAAAVDALDDRGAWVERGEITRLDGSEMTTEIIDSRTFIKNLRAIADYVGSTK